ncbi:SubName: Full=Uncharacterized protein {ECO:0000313/EMBL:CCA73654.1} [Serendipita indica DSM 11827]|nr:SubName: Full=Uncharacterized protein {ECO:0000313/EMBL:CCA73654.1} [Serendipita indica DSM 11827]
MAPDIDLDGFANAVHESIDAIQPWVNARSDLPVVQGTLATLQQQVWQYCANVKDSAGAASSGARFAEQAQQLCTYLLDKSTPTFRIRRHIDDMKKVARQAQQEAHATTLSFRESRRSLNEAKEAKSDAKASAIVKSILFPLGIPWFIEKAERKRAEARWVMQDSMVQANQCAASRVVLSQLSGSIEHMAHHIESLTNWWIEVETALNSIAENVEIIQGDGYHKLRLIQLRKRWFKLRGEYLRYTQELD